MLKDLVIFALGYIAAATVVWQGVSYFSNRYWSRYPGALKDMQERDNEWSRKKGWVR